MTVEIVEKAVASSIEAFAAVCGLDLEPFQRRIVRAVARGTREVVVSLPRGNGKTALMALVALHHLVTVTDAKVVVAASSRQQATNLFEYAERFARELGDPHVVHRTSCCAGARTRRSQRCGRVRWRSGRPTTASCTG